MHFILHKNTPVSRQPNKVDMTNIKNMVSQPGECRRKKYSIEVKYVKGHRSEKLVKNFTKSNLFLCFHTYMSKLVNFDGLISFQVSF